MYRNNFWCFLAEIWPKKTTSRDGCGLLILGDNSIIGAFPLFLLLAIAAFGGPERDFSLAIIAFGAFRLIVPKYDYRLGKMENLRSLASLFKEVTVFKVCTCCYAAPLNSPKPEEFMGTV